MRALAVGCSRSRRPSADAAARAPGARVDHLSRLAHQSLGRARRRATERTPARTGSVRRVGHRAAIRRARSAVRRRSTRRARPRRAFRRRRPSARRDRSAPSRVTPSSPAPRAVASPVRRAPKRHGIPARSSARLAAPSRTGSVGAVISAGSVRDFVGADDRRCRRRRRRARRRAARRRRSSRTGPRRATRSRPAPAPIHTAKWRTLSPGSSSGSSSTRAGEPAALGRRGAHDDFLVRRRGAARERAAVERDAIRRRVARQKARRDRAARRPARGPRLGERHGAIRRRRAARHVQAASARRRSAAACCHSVRWPSVSSAICRASSPARTHDAAARAERRRRDRLRRRSARGDRSRRAACARDPPRTRPSIVTSQSRSAASALDERRRAPSP